MVLLDAEPCIEAIKNGSFEDVKMTCRNVLLYTTTECNTAAEYGRITILRWLRAQDPPFPWDEQTCSHAAYNGHFEVLKWLREQDPPCPWDKDTCDSAASNAHWDIVKWGRLQDPPLPWGMSTCASAAELDDEEMLKWLRDQIPPCPWGTETCTRVAAKGNISLLRWLRAQKPPCPWEPSTCSYAAFRGNLDVLKFLRAQTPPCPWDKMTCSNAARGKYLNILKWLRNGNDPPCPWDEETCGEAALCGNLHMMRWLRSQQPPCPWDASVFAYAASSRNFELVKWLHDQTPSCPWDQVTCKNALTAHDFEMLEWLRSQNPPCPWSDEDCQTALKFGLSNHSGCNTYVYDRQFPLITALRRNSSLSVTGYIRKLHRWFGNHELTQTISNLSINISAEGELSFLFQSHEGNGIVAILYDDSGGFRVHEIANADSPSFVGTKKAFFTRNFQIFMTTFDDNQPTLICRDLTGGQSSCSGVFGYDTDESFKIVSSILPLRIFHVNPLSPLRGEMTNVKHTYGNLEKIDRSLGRFRENDSTHFQCASHGIQLKKSTFEYLFIGQVILDKTSDCFPLWFASLPEFNQEPKSICLMFFYTVKYFRDGADWQLHRMSCCFQPPDVGFSRLISIGGFTFDSVNDRFIVSYVRNEDDCRLTCYSSAEVEVLLRPVETWSFRNFMIHPNFASSLLTNFDDYCQPRQNWHKGDLRLTGICDTSELHRFNPCITCILGTQFLNVARVTENVRQWSTRNDVVLQSMTLDVLLSGEIKLNIARHSEFVVTLGVSDQGGEDPRFIVDDSDASLLAILVNDLNDDSRYMMMHSLNKTDIAPSRALCRNLSSGFEKNWSPFFHNGELLFVYSIDPLLVMKTGLHSIVNMTERNAVECEIFSSSDTPSEIVKILKMNRVHMRGGTPGLRISDHEYLFCGHSVTDTYKHCFPDYVMQTEVVKRGDHYSIEYGKLYCIFFYTIVIRDSKWVLNRLSCCSHLPGKLDHYSKIVFPCGLTRTKLSWDPSNFSYIVSYGERDQWSNYSMMTENFLKFILRPVDHWRVNNYVIDINYFSAVANMNPDYKVSYSDTFASPLKQHVA